MHNFLYSLTIDKEYGRIIKHFGKYFDIVLFKSLAGISKLQLTIGVLPVSNFRKHGIRELILPA
jgi:hypothetical protein